LVSKAERADQKEQKASIQKGRKALIQATNTQITPLGVKNCSPRGMSKVYHPFRGERNATAGIEDYI
jgi:hypothetical protein